MASGLVEGFSFYCNCDEVQGLRTVMLDGKMFWGYFCLEGAVPAVSRLLWRAGSR